MDKQISQSIDFLRFPLACMVVNLHLMGSYTNWTPYNYEDFCRFTVYDHLSACTNILFQTAVPIFFFISGYLFTNAYTFNFKKKILKKTRNILFPFLVWNAIAYLLFVITKLLGIGLHGKDIENLYHVFSPLFILKCLVGDFSKGFPCSPMDEPLWFIRDLYVLFLLSPFFLFIIKKIGRSFICLLVALFVLNVKGWPCLQVQSILFFCMGIYCRLNNIGYLKLLERNKALLVFVSIVSFFIRYIVGGRFELLMPIFIISASCCMVLASIKFSGNVCAKICSYKKYSFWIYALHFLLIQKLWGMFYAPLLRQNPIIASLAYVM